MLQSVPVRPVPESKSTFQTTELDGVRYRIAFYFVKNGDFWMMDFADVEGTKLVTGIRLALGVDLLEPYKYLAGMPQGQLFVVDTSRTDVEPGDDGFDDRCVLYFRPAADV